ncbi:MAG: PHP domain-containing protein [Clostridiales bacterium]|jgi:predicted metal-dependent phosphoesterase TrpH|nr:PHP domain-containing protein [Clostridiales bacterium]
MTTVVADFHIHTLASDGLLSPRKVVADASAKGLLAIAVTDHDTVAGLPEALASARQLSMELIPGIELSTEFAGKEIHILGYFIDPYNQYLNSLLATLQESRQGRAKKMVDKLTGLGYQIELSAVLRHAGGAAPGRPHVARALVEAGYIQTVRQAFDELIGYQMPGYVERYKLSPQEAIGAIQVAGGVAAWAHPGLTEDDTLLQTFISAGLQGIEVYHPDHDSVQSSHYKGLANAFNLFAVGGSDFHGQEAGHVRELGCQGLSAQEYRDFQDYFRRYIRK